MKPKDGSQKEIAFVVIVFGMLAVGVYRERERADDPVVLTSSGVASAPTFEELVLPLGSLRVDGTVEASDGAPASGVEVFLSRANPAPGSAEPLHWTLTDEAGRFALDELHEAEYRVVLLRPGLRPLTFTLEVPATAPPVWRLEAPLSELEALPPLVRADLAGRVAAPLDGAFQTRRSLAGYEIVIVPAPGTDVLSGAAKRRARLAADGTFRFDRLVTAEYTLQLLPPWAASSSWPVLDEVAYTHTAGADAPSLEVKATAVTGTLENTDGRSIPGALVRIHSQTNTTHAWPPTETDDDGRFVIVDLPPGPYRLVVRAGSEVRETTIEVQAGATHSVTFNPLDFANGGATGGTDGL